MLIPHFIKQKKMVGDVFRTTLKMQNDFVCVTPGVMNRNWLITIAATA
jgi:hypothetical protein